MSVHAGSLFVAVPAALAGAACMGLASAAQARATKEIPRFHTLDPALLRELLNRPMWMIGIVATVVGLALQLFALAFAPLILVQPLLVTSLIFGAVFAALLHHRRVDRMIVAGALVCTSGLAAFLLVARPSGQAEAIPGWPRTLPLAVVLAAVAALGLAVGAFNRRSLGVLGLALATGVFYGVTAGLMKVIASQLRESPLEPLRHWPLYAACVVGPVGFLLSQNTFQRGRMIAPALSVITTVDPLVGVAIGVWWLGEQVNSSPAALAGETIAAIAIILGIVALNTRATRLPGELVEETPQPQRKAAKSKTASRMDELAMPRVLIVSADMGEGHNTAGRVLERAVRELWPRAEVSWLDTLDVMGPGVGPVFRQVYVTNVQRTPWLYEYFYSSLWRRRWFAEASKRFVGAWCGRRLRRVLRAHRPDLIVSTYPLGTTGLDWLRRRGEIDVPVGAWVTDFAPHPFWVYDSIDLNMVMHGSAVPLAHQCVPDAPVTVSAPPVGPAFRPGDRDTARDRLGLPADAFVALVSCGSLGFGDVEAATRELLSAGESVVPVVICGRNERLRQRLERLAASHPRVRVLGWTDRMPELVVAADVVVTNAGGLTGLEALACGTPVLMYRPIAAHGRANARLMADAGLAVMCEHDGELAATVADLIARPERLSALSRTARAYATGGGRLGDSLLRLAEHVPETEPEPVRPEDALFAHIDTPQIPQQVGAVMMFDPMSDGTPLSLSDAEFLLSATPRAGQRLRRGGSWTRPAWLPGSGPRPPVTERPVPPGPDQGEALGRLIDEFFGYPIDLTRGTSEAWLLSGLDGGRTALLVKVHHAAADGIAVLNALLRRAKGDQPLEYTPSAAPKSSPAEMVRGAWALARSGRAPASALPAQTFSTAPHHSLVTLPYAELRAAARGTGCEVTDLTLGLVAAALREVLGERAGPRIRALVPVSMRTSSTVYRKPGNHTGAACVDLPTGAMPLLERIAASREALRGGLGSGSAVAAHAVVLALGSLPTWAHRGLARLAYRGTWFSLIASVMPGPARTVRLGSAVLRVAYPVLPLAPGVNLAIGAMRWSDKLAICVSAQTGSPEFGDRLALAIESALGRLHKELAAAPPPPSSRTR